MTLMILTPIVFIALFAVLFGVRYRTGKRAKQIRDLDAQTIALILTAAARYDASRDITYDALPSWAFVELWVNPRNAVQIAEDLHRQATETGNAEKELAFRGILENVTALYSTHWHLLLQCLFDRVCNLITGCGRNPYVGATASSYRRIMREVGHMATLAESDYARLFQGHI